MSPKISGFAFAVFLFASSPTLAAVYKCESSDGRIAFSDLPCNDASSGQKLEKFSRLVSKQVSAAVSNRQTTRRYIDGYAYWAKPHRELTAVLYLRTLGEDELKRIAAGERLNTYAEESTGRVTLLFDEPRAGRGTLRHMRSVFTGFSPSNLKAPWTSNHGRDDLPDVLQKFDLGTDDEGRVWLQLRSRESTENIRWEIEFVLPVEP